MTMNKLSVNIVTGNSTLTPLSAEEIAEREAYERDVQPGIDLQTLREERDRRLAETDWQIVKHKELGTNIPAALKTYRQELRDLPENTSDPANPIWPVKPS
jgi:hypothetical protein